MINITQNVSVKMLDVMLSIGSGFHAYQIHTFVSIFYKSIKCALNIRFWCIKNPIAYSFLGALLQRSTTGFSPLSQKILDLPLSMAYWFCLTIKLNLSYVLPTIITIVNKPRSTVMQSALRAIYAM